MEREKFCKLIGFKVSYRHNGKMAVMSVSLDEDGDMTLDCIESGGGSVCFPSGVLKGLIVGIRELGAMK